VNQQFYFFAGHPRTFKCVAEGGRPAGKFTWRIGDSKDPKGTLVLTNPSPPVITTDENKYSTVVEVSFNEYWETSLSLNTVNLRFLLLLTAVVSNYSWM